MNQRSFEAVSFWLVIAQKSRDGEPKHGPVVRDTPM